MLLRVSLAQFFVQKCSMCIRFLGTKSPRFLRGFCPWTPTGKLPAPDPLWTPPTPLTESTHELGWVGSGWMESSLILYAASPARSASKRAVATDVAHSVVCVSVCLSVCVGQTGNLCKNGWTDRDAVGKSIYGALRKNAGGNDTVPISVRYWVLLL